MAAGARGGAARGARAGGIGAATGPAGAASVAHGGVEVVAAQRSSVTTVTLSPFPMAIPPAYAAIDGLM
jgi:hypothetical protein